MILEIVLYYKWIKKLYYTKNDIRNGVVLQLVLETTAQQMILKIVLYHNQY